MAGISIGGAGGIKALPWWGKIGAKIVLSRLPFGYAVWQRLRLFRHGDMDSGSYALEVFDFHIRRARLLGQLAGKTILELGPGDSVATALTAAAYKARAILVDTGPYARMDMGNYQTQLRHMINQAIKGPDIGHCKNIGEMLEVCGATYLTNGLKSLEELPDHSVDLVFSHAVLEHVRHADFTATMAECRRILKPGGAFSNQVDLKDHLSGALNNLRFSERIWESDLFSKSGFYTNRIRYSKMLQMFRDAGFTIEALEKKSWNHLPTKREKLAEPFRTLPEDELCVSDFTVLLR